MSTVLSQQLSGDTAPRPTALDAFRLARRAFLSGSRVEMGPLAAQLGVSRVTLNRWVGSRDLLLAEVLWSLAEPELQRARSVTTSRGGKRIADTVHRFLTEVLAAPSMRALLNREPEIALRILTTARTPFQRRVCGYIRDMIINELTPEQIAMDPDDLAYVIVRIGESFSYTDLITGGEPSPDRARQAISALLGC